MTDHIKSNLFSSFALGPFTLSHRVVMPPLTRMRADPENGTQSALAATCYGQRATFAGLIIGEGTQISRQGQGYNTDACHLYYRTSR